MVIKASAGGVATRFPASCLIEVAQECGTNPVFATVSGTYGKVRCRDHDVILARIGTLHESRKILGGDHIDRTLQALRQIVPQWGEAFIQGDGTDNGKEAEIERLGIPGGCC